MGDMVGQDREARDTLNKRMTVKMWESINDLGAKYNDFDNGLDKLVTEKIDDEIEMMQKKFNKMLSTAIGSKKVSGNGLDSEQASALNKLENLN